MIIDIHKRIEKLLKSGNLVNFRDVIFHMYELEFYEKYFQKLFYNTFKDTNYTIEYLRYFYKEYSDGIIEAFLIDNIVFNPFNGSLEHDYNLPWFTYNKNMVFVLESNYFKTLADYEEYDMMRKLKYE